MYLTIHNVQIFLVEAANRQLDCVIAGGTDTTAYEWAGVQTNPISIGFYLSHQHLDRPRDLPPHRMEPTPYTSYE